MTSPFPTLKLNSESGPAPLVDPKGAVDLSQFAKKRDHDQLVGWTNDNYQKIKTARSTTEQQWYTNLAFYFGKQYIMPIRTPNTSGNAFRFTTPQAPPWRVRMVSNKVRPIIRTELAKITSQKPTASVYPASNDEDDIFAARAGEQVFDSIYRRKKIQRTLRSASFWTLICGNGFIKDWWDPNAIDPDADSPGDIMLAPETPFHIMVPDFREEDIENQPYIMHASTKSPDWIKAHYGPLLGDRTITANTSGSKDILENAFLNLVGANELTRDQVICLEVWIKPGGHPLFPQGGMYTMLGDQIVQIIGMQGESWPFKHNQYPITKLDHIPTGKFYSESTITDLIPLQKEYNRTRSQIIEAKNRMAKPQLMAFKGSINPNQMTTEPGQVILVTPGFQMPVPLQMQPLPNYVIEELNRCEQDMNDISGQHEITKGQVPPGVTAATAISFLQEQDDSKISHTVESIEMAMEKVAQHILSHVVQYWDEPRVVKVVGTDGAYDATMLKGSDLRGNTDLQIEAGSALPTSRAAKTALITDWMKMGFVTPEQGMRVLEFGGINKLYDEMQTDIRQAQRENLRMQRIQPPAVPNPLEALFGGGQAQPPVEAPQIDPMTGQPVPPQPQITVNTWDNHQVHMETHNKYRKSAAFEQLDPAVKQEFESHVQQHTVLMQQQMPQQMPAMPGQPPQDPSQLGQQVPPQMGGQPNG